MSNNEPILDLRNYTEKLKQVDELGRAYLTQNAQREYENLTTAEIEKLDHYRAAYTFITKLKKAEERANKEGWIFADDVEKELGVSD